MHMSLQKAGLLAALLRTFLERFTARALPPSRAGVCRGPRRAPPSWCRRSRPWHLGDLGA